MYYEKIKNIIEINFGIKNVDYYANFNQIGLDSLDKVELITQTEEEFKIEISDEECEFVQTVSDLIELIRRKKN